MLVKKKKKAGINFVSSLWDTVLIKCQYEENWLTNVTFLTGLKYVSLVYLIIDKNDL